MAKININDKSTLEHIKVERHRGKWYVIENMYVSPATISNYNGKPYWAFLCEHETYGDETACVIINEDGELILDDVWNDWDDLDEYYCCQNL